MARGAPDYSNVKSEQAIYTLMDLGELAARLGSIDVFDRSGNIVWMDDFEAPTLNWQDEHIGTLSEVALSTAYRLMGAQSCLLTTGSDGTMLAKIYRYLMIPNLSDYSLELAFACDSDITTLTWYIDHIQNGWDHTYGIQYNRTAKTLSYLNSAGGFTVFANNVLPLMAVYIFHTGKLTVDLTTDQYKQFRFDQITYDLSSIACWPNDLGIPNAFRVMFEAVGKPTKNALCYVDNALVKQNEP